MNFYSSTYQPPNTSFFGARQSHRYGFQGMEGDAEMKGEGNSYDFGARMLDPRIGRWLTIDPLASKYPSLNPYCFVGNTPLIAIDPDGKEIIFVVTKQNDGTLLVEMTLTAKLIDESREKISDEKMNEYANRISTSISDYYGAATGTLTNVKDAEGNLVSGPFTMKVTVNIEVATADELDEKDHAIIIRDPGKLPDEESETCLAPKNVDGLSEPGSNYIYLSKKILEKRPAVPIPGAANGPYVGTGLTDQGETSLERTAGHELGHNALGTYNERYGHDNPWFGNLLTSSSQKHHAGTKINPQQIEMMITEYQKGRLNDGRQEGPKN